MVAFQSYFYKFILILSIKRTTLIRKQTLTFTTLLEILMGQMQTTQDQAAKPDPKAKQGLSQVKEDRWISARFYYLTLHELNDLWCTCISGGGFDIGVFSIIRILKLFTLCLFQNTECKANSKDNWWNYKNIITVITCLLVEVSK
jgi:hypothetical protein